MGIMTALRWTVIAVEPVALAEAAEPGSAVDRPIARTPWGDLYLPATSLAGSLRSHLRPLGLATRLMGSESPLLTEDDGALTESRIALLGTTVTGRVATSVATRTAIDRRRAAARGQQLYSTEQVEPGLTFELRAVATGELCADELEALASWPLWLGGQRTNGFGRCHTETFHHGSIDLDSPAGRRLWLTHTGPERVDAIATTPLNTDVVMEVPVLDVCLEVVDEVWSVDPSRSGDGDAGNLLSFAERGGDAWISGASLKGVVRSHAEYIVRSLGAGACVSQDCGSCLTCDLFGSPEQRGRLRILASPIDDPDAIATHTGNAIDRITGGVAENFLYSIKRPVGGRLRLRVEAMPCESGPLAELPPWAVPLLEAVVRDLHDGIIGVGHSTTRGAGTVRVAPPAEPPPLRDLRTHLIARPGVSS